MADPARVLEDALSLAPTDRARVARELIESLDAADVGVEAAWRDEIHRRVDEVEAGTAEIEDWETVRRRLHAAAGR